MKTTRITLLFALLFFAVSCKKDNVKPVTTVENASLSLASGSQVISMPPGLEKASDLHAEYVVDGIQTVNGMADMFVYLKVPAGATKTTTQIVASNARTATAGDFVVYTWTDAQSGKNVAYQASETADSFVFEVFLMFPGQANWLKYFHAEEKKDKSTGSLTLLDIFGVMGNDLKAVWIFYSWRNTDDTFTFSLTDKSTNVIDVFTVNKKDNSGTMTEYRDNYKTHEMIWDAKGGGRWTDYNPDGIIEASGNWAAA